MTSQDNTESIKGLTIHDHICSIYSDENEQKAQFVPYLQAGLLAGERVIYFSEHNKPDDIIGAMEENGFNIKAYIERRAFIILSATEYYLPSERFEWHGMTASWTEMVARAKAEGFFGIRAAAEMTWATSNLPGCESLEEYEVKMNKLARECNVSFLCQYHRTRFTAEVLQGIVHAHPYIIKEDGSLLSNPACLTPEDYDRGAQQQHLQAILDTLSNANKLAQSNEKLRHILAEQKRLQRELHKIEQDRRDEEIANAEAAQCRLIAEAIPQIVWIGDVRGIVDYVNPYWSAYTGLNAEETLGTGWTKALHPDDVQGIQEFWVNKVAIGKPVEHEVRLRAADGSYRWHLNRSVPVLNRERKVVKWLGACVDIDRQKELSEELANARDKALSNAILKSRFLANMSHEIRTPMNAVIGMCNILLKTPLEPVQYHYASNIREGAGALLAVINDILDSSKIEAGKLELEQIDFDPVATVENVCELLATTARSNGLSLVTYLDPQIPLLLNGDPQRLRQILINLVANAIKFSNHGEIVVRADVQENDGNNIELRFSVCDQGIGIAPEKQALLFQPFSQADGSITHQFGSTGLGLSICKGLVDLMSGTIGLRSKPNEGSTFWFVVPLKVKSAQRAIPGTINNIERLKDIKILIADPEKCESQIIASYVSACGMKPTICDTAQASLEALKQAGQSGERFDIALIARDFTDESGLKLAKDIIADKSLATKLLLVSAVDSPELSTESAQSGFNAYLTRPVRQTALLQLLVDSLQDNVGPSEPEAPSGSSEETAPVKRSELILIAEDNRINQLVAKIYVEDLGFTPHIVSNGVEVLKAIAENTYAMVLMDCEMPELDGFGATKAIRDMEKESGKHLPIVAVTGHAMEEERQFCLNAGMDEHLCKPLDQDKLRALIDELVPVPGKNAVRCGKVV
jgi:PAS domain S-box-containing protein